MNTNLFQLPDPLPQAKDGEEFIETLAGCEGGVPRIERIISAGQASPEGFWYDQPEDEWVALVQGRARLAWADGRARDLAPGDWLFIPAHERHRVEWTSSAPPCIWIAVFLPAK